MFFHRTFLIYHSLKFVNNALSSTKSWLVLDFDNAVFTLSPYFFRICTFTIFFEFLRRLFYFYFYFYFFNALLPNLHLKMLENYSIFVATFDNIWFAPVKPESKNHVAREMRNSLKLFSSLQIIQGLNIVPF